MVTRLKHVVSSRSILLLLVRRDLRLRYAGAKLGYVWTVLEPLLLSLVYWVIFTKVFARGAVGYEPYLLFLLCGILPWNWFTSATNGGCKALTAEAKIVRSNNVPREVWVARVVIAKMFEFIFAIPIIIAVALLYRHPPTWGLLALPLVLLVQLGLTYGLALILAPVTVLASDVKNVVRIVLRVGFYLSPVIYSVRNLPEPLATLAALNPMAGILAGYRLSFWSGDSVQWLAVASSVVAAVFVVLVGSITFRRLEGAVLKEI